ncbi:acyl-CoA--sterol O-acyltransferase 1 isoform X3 [Pyrus x bretschneideri]|uniref:acyl-CoA--sterol O-acyltransferase 1 isoform X2 n=1 Tax=Pyrus x bretschneideri TaxID=225117 RepID=UPI00202E3DEB|nr:acyl-CoA--sterol O-acyltransferase 1 isoform X2 [Pyrus x bretschneideri]XP_048426376.1 acyl-CoA--sterol O-acyltransferase 1 isoform X3 [Pyrus x bretschneideri]
MEGEFFNFIQVWSSVFACFFYSHSIGKFVPKGTTRLFCVLPVVFLFLYLPLNFSSMHLEGGTAFFISWLGSFKLLLFAFGKGPLASHPPISIGRFLAIGCLPIEFQENPPPKSPNPKFETYPSPSKSHPNGQMTQNPPPKSQNPKIETYPSPSKSNPNRQNGENPPQKSQNSKIETNPSPQNAQKLSLNQAIKGILFIILIGVLKYSEHFHQKLVLVLHCLYIYLNLENLLAIVTILTRSLSGLDLKPHFNDPYFSTSLQNFWGRRWNLVLHGVCLPVEIVLKKALKGRCRLPKVISVPLTLGFMVVTSYWLFFPQFIRCKADVRMLQEYGEFAAFLKNVIPSFR